MADETVEASGQLVVDTANPILDRVPIPPGWQQRHICAWSDPINRSVCVFFPWPV
jgi:hypothetical protein